MFLPLGRQYVSVVSFTAAGGSVRGSRSIFCTLPFPYDRSPTTTARRWSCSAAATISLALALDRLTSTAIGFDAAGANTVSPAFADQLRTIPLRFLLATTTPSSRNRSATETAWLSSPPG